MNRMTSLYFVNVGLGLAFLANAATGIAKYRPVMELIFQSGIRLPVWMNDLHVYSGILMTLLVLVHLVLNFNWIVGTTKTIVKGFGI